MGAEDISVVEKLKAQRDRFIAFAFAGADLLLELNDQGSIVYSAGAGEAIYGLSDNELIHKQLASFVHPRDRKRFDESIQRLKNTGRLEQVGLTLVGGQGTVTKLRMAGIRLPQFPNAYHLVLSRLPALAAADPARMEAEVDHKARFVDMVRQRLNEGNRIGQDYILTLFDLSGSNFSGAEPGMAQSFFATVLDTLEECSVRGSSAGALSEHSFGVVHDQSVSAEVVQKRVAALAGKFSTKAGVKAEVKMRSATLEMEDASLSDDDIGKALTYIVNGFAKDSSRFVMKSLAEGAQKAVEETLSRVKNFRKMVKGGDDKLVFLFQPVVNLRTGAVLKYEAFCRISHNGGFFVPHQIIPFATDVGLIGEFDLLAVGKALKMLKSPTEISPLAIIAINISGYSLGNPGFYRTLLKMLEENRQVLGRLVLEITDASHIYNLDEARRLLARIRKLGARISLDDFGSGGAAFDLLRMLPVDFAKMDHTYILDARDPKGRSVLKAITTLCHDLGIVTVGECVEDIGMMQILRDANVDYAQGYYFGQPTHDAAKRIKYFTEQVKAAGTAEPSLSLVSA